MGYGYHRQSMESPLLLCTHNEAYYDEGGNNWVRFRKTLLFSLAFLTISFGAVFVILLLGGGPHDHSSFKSTTTTFGKHKNLHDVYSNDEIIKSDKGVVAADDGRCSEVGASMLRNGGHAVDAAVATSICLGVVSPMSSGIGGGAFMIVHSSETSTSEAFDMRETAPAAASQDMYQNNPAAKSKGALSMGVPGEIAGLHKAWSKYGRLPWHTLLEPGINYARDGFVVAPYLAHHIGESKKSIMADPGLKQVYAPNGTVLQAGDVCYNVELANSLKEIAEQGPKAFYDGIVGEKLVKDVKEAGGILTMEDLRNYEVKVANALVVDVMGYTVMGMPPPSSGTLGFSMVLNILDSYGSSNATEGPLGLHRLIEAMKHMFAVRMNLGDPAFVDISRYLLDMTSTSFAKKIQEKIFDNTTFPADYYMGRWSQLQDNGTSHFCIVDAERNGVSMTTTVNYIFGAGVLSPSTGIVLNNEMDDFSTPTEVHPDMLPPAPANFIKPGKRPLSSMTPLVIVKDDQLVGVIGGSGGSFIISAVIQVFLNHFVLGMEPLAAVQNPRVYHKLIPNTVVYENWTVIDGNHIELPDENKVFLKNRGHKLIAEAGGAICQFVVQTLDNHAADGLGRKAGKANKAHALHNVHGVLTAVSDPRKDGRPAAM